MSQSDSKWYLTLIKPSLIDWNKLELFEEIETVLGLMSGSVCWFLLIPLPGEFLGLFNFLESSSLTRIVVFMEGGINSILEENTVPIWLPVQDTVLLSCSKQIHSKPNIQLIRRKSSRIAFSGRDETLRLRSKSINRKYHFYSEESIFQLVVISRERFSLLLHRSCSKQLFKRFSEKNLSTFGWGLIGRNSNIISVKFMDLARIKY